MKKLRHCVCVCVFECYKLFSENKIIKDNQYPGSPAYNSTQQIVTKISEIVRGDCRMSIRMIAETNNCKETVRKILHDELNLNKVCAKLVPKYLTPDQKLIRQQTCSDFLERMDEEPEFMQNIISCDKIWSGNPCTEKLQHCQE